MGTRRKSDLEKSEFYHTYLPTRVVNNIKRKRQLDKYIEQKNHVDPGASVRRSVRFHCWRSVTKPFDRGEAVQTVPRLSQTVPGT